MELCPHMYLYLICNNELICRHVVYENTFYLFVFASLSVMCGYITQWENLQGQHWKDISEDSEDFFHITLKMYAIVVCE